MCGDWSAIKTQLYNNVLTRDANGLPLTFTTTKSAATAFAGYQVPVSLYVPIALKVLALVPPGDPITGKITYTTRSLSNNNQFVARVDRNFGDKLRLSVSFLRDPYASPAVVDPKNALTFADDSIWYSTHAAVNATYAFGPSLVTTVGATLSRVVVLQTGVSNAPNYNALGANFPYWIPTNQYETGGNTGWYSWSQNAFYDVSRTQQDFTNSWTYMRGNHLFEFGAEVTNSQSILNQDYIADGQALASGCSYSGYSGLDFLMGQNCNYQQYGPLYDAARGKPFGMYVNDKWRVKRGLTLNIGVRWEPWVFWPDKSAANMGQVIDEAAFKAGTRSTMFPNLPPGLLVRGDPGIPNTIIASDWPLFDPRIGLAWDVRGNGKTSIRAGAGVYHDQPFGNYYNAWVLTFPFVTSYMITDPTVPWFNPYKAAPYNGVIPTLQVPPARNTQFTLPLSSAIGLSPDFKPQATAQWNLTVEQQLGKGFLLRTSYIASESWHMPSGRDINAGVYIPGVDSNGNPLSTSANVSQRRPWYPQYGGRVILDYTVKTSSYNSLNLSMEKRMTGSLSLLGGYRWSKCLDENELFGGDKIESVIQTNVMFDYGRCNSDIASQLKMAVVYALPTLKSWGFAGRNVLGGWTMSGIWNWRDGSPFSATGSIDANLDGNNNERADIVGNPYLPGNRPKSAVVAQYFNVAAFQNAAIGTPGNSPRNFLRGPGFFNLDYSLIKSFPIPYGPLKETQKIDFRAEFFNIFNHANFNNPTSALSSAQKGQLLSAMDPRIIQFALKFIF